MAEDIPHGIFVLGINSLIIQYGYHNHDGWGPNYQDKITFATAYTHVPTIIVCTLNGEGQVNICVRTPTITSFYIATCPNYGCSLAQKEAYWIAIGY